MKKIIAKYKADHCEELSTRELEMFDWVLKKQGIGQSGAQCIVTTHELFILKELYKLDGYEKIIDEDILMTLFRQMYKLPILEKFIRQSIRENLFNILQKHLAENI